MAAILTALSGRFNALPFKLIAILAVGLVVVLILLMVYREGRHAGDQAAAVALAKHNAEIAAKFMRDSKAAEDAAARERARAEELASQVATLKEQVRNVAKGNASPGVDFAVHGVRGPAGAAGKPAVPRAPR